MTAPSGFSAPARRTVTALLLAFAVAHGLYQIGRAFLHPKQGLDLAPAYLAGRMAREGSRAFYDDPTVGKLGTALGIHGPDGAGAPVLNFIYPPWVPAVYAPVSFLPWDAARRAWLVLSFLCFVTALLAAIQAAVPEARRKAATMPVLAAACFFFPFFYGLMTGQANDLLLLLVAGALLLLVRRQPLLAGAILAPAILWKPFLAAVVPFLVLRREWKALAGLAVGGVSLVALSVPVGSEGGWTDWLRQISQHNALTAAEPRNHSLAAAVLSFGLPPAWILPVTRVLQGLAIVAAGALILPKTRPGETRYALQFGGSLVAALLLTPKAWEHYGVFLLPAFIAATALAIEEESPPLWPALLGASFAVWGLMLQGRDEYRALADVGLAFLAPAKSGAAVVLLLVAVRLVWKRRAHSAGTVARPSR
ncbi:MAG TPA: glycosyltransferase family 87 protein [Thermoanaerobaculia bacterium]